MLTQAEADQLMQMTKHFVRAPASITIPPGVDDTYELADPNDRERFLLDIWRGTLRLTKVRFQNRVRTVVVLVRLDVDGAPHTNPDGGSQARMCTFSGKDLTTNGLTPSIRAPSPC